MEKNKLKTGTAEIVTVDGQRFLKLVQIFPDGRPKTIIGIPIELPEIRNPFLDQPRFLNASLLNTQQKTDEKYTTDNHIA